MEIPMWLVYMIGGPLAAISVAGALFCAWVGWLCLTNLKW